MKHRLPKPKAPKKKSDTVKLNLPDMIDDGLENTPVPVSKLSSPVKKAMPPPLPGNESEPASLLIQTQGLVKQYGGRRVVNGVDIHVRSGEVVGLLGKNGAGKTTTFYMIVGLVTPTEGTVHMGSEDVTRMPMYRRARRGIGYLPQEESIFRKLTVEENLLAILETLPMTEDERDARCDELLKDFGLEHVRENVAITLSGGEKRRVTIARALVTSPTLQRRRPDGGARYPGNHSPLEGAGPGRLDHRPQRARDAFRGGSRLHHRRGPGAFGRLARVSPQ